MRNKISILLLVVILLQGGIFAQGKGKGGPSGMSQGRGPGSGPGGPGGGPGGPGSGGLGGPGRQTGLTGPSARPTIPGPRPSGPKARPSMQAAGPSVSAMPTQRPSISAPQRPQPREDLGIRRLRREGPEGIEQAPERRTQRVERLERRIREKRPERRPTTEREERLERIRKERPEREERAAQRREQRKERLERIEGRPERVAPREKEEQLGRATEQFEKQKEEINTFAQKQMQQKPELASEIKSAEKTWKTDPIKQKLWQNHWKKYSHYHHFKHFNFNTFIHFVFFAPWYLFPFDFYPTFYYHYPIYWTHIGWLSYPSYWDYGYAREIRLVEYVQDEDFDIAIDKLEKQLDQLEDEVLEQRRDEATLQAKITEIVWLLNDLKKIILDQARISRREKDRLTIRIDRIKDRAHQLIDRLQGYY